MSTTINDADEVRINTTTLRDQSAPAIAKLSQGHVVVWQSEQPPPDYSNPKLPPGFDLYMQRFDERGNAVGVETHVNSVAINDQVEPAVCALPDGGFAVAWASAREHGITRFDHGVYFQRFDAQGQRVGAETQANNFYGLDQIHPSIAALANGGGFVITWWSDVQSTTPPGIYARVFDANGSALGPEARIGTTAGSQSDSGVAGLADGGFVIVWDSVSGVYAQHFDDMGVPISGERLVNTGAADGAARPAVAALADGSYVVTWKAADAQTGGIYAQRFGPDGTAWGGEIAVNATTSGDQSAPSVTALASGGFTVAWTSYGPDGSGAGVFSQSFDASGQAIGDEIQLNRFTAGDQAAVSLASDGQGGLLAAWTSAAQDGSGAGVYATRVEAPVATGAAAYVAMHSATQLDIAIVDAQLSQVTGFSLSGKDLTITTTAGTQVFNDPDRLQLDDALFAFDTQPATGEVEGGSVWQAAALLWAGLGVAPTMSLLSQWTAQADVHDDIGALGQAMLDYYVDGVSSEALVAHIYTTLARVAPTADTVDALVGTIGAGRLFDTQGDFFAAAAGLAINTDQFADLTGSVQPLDMSWFLA